MGRLGLSNKVHRQRRCKKLPPLYMLLVYVLLLSIISFFWGCSMRQIKYVWKESPKHEPSQDTSFSIEKRKLLVKAQLNNKEGLFLLDFGADRNVIWDTSAISPNHIFDYRKAKGHTGEKKVLMTSYRSLEFLDLKIEHPIFYLLEAPHFNNLKDLGILGLISGSYYNEIGKCVHVNFSGLEINQSECSAVAGGFTEVKSKIDVLGRVYIYLILGDVKETRFKFDTGAQLSLGLPKSESELGLPRAAYYGKLGADITGEVYDTLWMHMAETRFSGTEVKADSQLIQQMPVLQRAIMGMDFIKQFDWIIDYENRKVYVRGNQNRHSVHNHPEYIVELKDGSLIVRMKRLNSKSAFKVGDIVLDNTNLGLNAEELLDLADSINTGKLLLNDIGFEK